MEKQLGDAQKQHSDDRKHLNEVQKQYGDVQKQLVEAQHEIRKLEEAKKVAEKENISQNSQSSVGAAENTIPLKSYEEVARKYDMAKRLCNLRNETIEKLNNDNSELEVYIKTLQDKTSEELSLITRKYMEFKEKYEHAKGICDLRKKKLQELRAKYGEPEPKAAEPTETMENV
jgi:lysyl-tRNA synthetase class II